MHVTASTPEPEGGARCVSSARRDLRGGRPATVASHPVCRAAAKGMADELQGERQAEGPCRCAQQERKQVVGADLGFKVGSAGS